MNKGIFMKKWVWPTFDEVEKKYLPDKSKMKGEATELWEKCKKHPKYGKKLKHIEGHLGSGGKYKVMFVGLNPNSEDKTGHKFDSNNVKLYIRLAKYNLQEAKITDLFPDCKSKKAGDINYKGKQLRRKSKPFLKMINKIKPNLIFCFGNTADEYLREILNESKLKKYTKRLTKLKDMRRIVKLKHYSAQISDEKKNADFIKVANKISKLKN